MPSFREYQRVLWGASFEPEEHATIIEKARQASASMLHFCFMGITEGFISILWRRYRRKISELWIPVFKECFYDWCRFRYGYPRYGFQGFYQLKFIYFYPFFASASPLVCACLFSVLLVCLYLFFLCRPSHHPWYFFSGVFSPVISWNRVLKSPNDTFRVLIVEFQNIESLTR